LAQDCFHSRVSPLSNTSTPSGSEFDWYWSCKLRANPAEMVAVARTFLCCFPLDVGVQAIMWLHLACNIYCCAMIMNLVVFKMPGWGYATSSSVQIATFIWCLAGIPLVLVGLQGFYKRGVQLVRLYWCYMVVSAVVDVMFVFHLFFLKDACANLRKDDALEPHGVAFACGVARTTSSIMAAFVTAAFIYMVYIVWSWISQLDFGGSAAIISEIFQSQSAKEKRRELPRYIPGFTKLEGELGGPITTISASKEVFY